MTRARTLRWLVGQAVALVICMAILVGLAAAGAFNSVGPAGSFVCGVLLGIAGSLSASRVYPLVPR